MENQQHCPFGVRNGIEDHWLGDISGVCPAETPQLSLENVSRIHRDNQAADVE
jgi:hypothetical protein